MITAKKIFTLLIYLVICTCVACQNSTSSPATSTPTNQELDQQVAQAAGLPDEALKPLQEVIGMLADGNKLRLKSAIQATNLQVIFDLSPSIQADEIWCTVWKSDTYTWGMGVYRKGAQWVSAFNAFMFPNNQVKVSNSEVWKAAGCSNFLNP